MQTTSIEYKDKVKSLTELRQWSAKIIYKQIDNTARTDCTPTSNDLKSESSNSYLIDKLENPTVNYATFEPDRFLLDGSFALTGDESTLEYIPTMNNTLSDINYEFDSDFIITLNFATNHSTSGLSIIFDIINNEYATDFDISYYNSSDVLMQTVSIASNILNVFADETAISNWRKIIITIKKWSQQYRLAKVNEIYFGLIKEFSNENDELISFKTQEQLDPLGFDIAGNTLTFDINNLNEQFNPLSPNSIYSYVVPQQEIQVFLGLKIASNYEYINCGTYYLKDIESKDDAITAKLNAEGLLNFLSTTKFEKSTLQNISMYDLALEVLQDTNLTSEQYVIDIALQSIIYDCYLPIMSHKECLQAIAIASRSILYENRLGQISIEQLNLTPSTATIDKTAMFKEAIITRLKALKAIEIEVNSYEISTEVKEVGKATINATGTITVKINYTNPSNNVSASLDSGTLNSATYYANLCILNITTASATTTITLEGKEIINTVNTQSYTTGNEQGETYSIKNALISESAEADNISNYIITIKSYINEVSINWRGDPALELTDILESIEHKFGLTNSVILTSSELDFGGALVSNSKFIGGIS